MRTFSPSGILEMDDGENWEHATVANAGYVTRHQKLCYAMDPTKEESIPIDLPGTVTKGQLNDANQRLFFKRYAEFMDAQSWKDIPLAKKQFE
jgi:ethylbenzene dioxygenase alpha subunit